MRSRLNTNNNITKCRKIKTLRKVGLGEKRGRKLGR